MPDEQEHPAADEGSAATERIGPDLTKPVPPRPPAAEPVSPWSDPGAQQPAAPPAYGAPQYGAPQYGAPQYGTPQYGAPQYGTPQYGTPQYGQPYAGPSTSGKATAVLVLGLASLVLVWMCGIGLVTAIIALVMAPGAKREIKESQGRLGGLGMVTGGVITSWISIGLLVLGILVWVLLMVVGTSIGSDYPYSEL